MNVVLIGMMGSGKSVVGQLLAKKLKWKFYDSDTLIEQQEKTSIASIFESKGEKHFRMLEKRMICRLTKKNRVIIATGGGAPCFHKNWEALSKNGFVIWLKANPKTLFRRLKKEAPETRPLLKGNAFTLKCISDLLRKRELYYGRADLILKTDHLTPKEIAKRIMELDKKGVAI